MSSHVTRDLSGIRIIGEHYGIWLHPVIDYGNEEFNLSSVGISAGQLGTFDRNTRQARLERDRSRVIFALDDIHVTDNLLRCMRMRSGCSSALREGFMLRLETGMAASLTWELPRVARVTQLTATLGLTIGARLGRPLSRRECYVLAELVAHCVLDREAPADALAQTCDHTRTKAFCPVHGDQPDLADLGDALRQPGIVAQLAVIAGRQEQGGARQLERQGDALS